MSWTFSVLVLLASTALALGMAFLLSRKRAAPGSRAMLMMFLGLAFWSFGYAMILVSNSMGARLSWLKFENIGIVSTPVFWLLFALQYTRNERWLPRGVVALLFLVPAVTLFLLFSGRWFDLYYSAVSGPAAGLGPLHIERGGWYVVQLAQNYLFLVLGFGLLLWQMVRLRAIYRRQIAFVLAALFVPFILNVVYQRGTSLLPGLDPAVDLTPISFMLTAVLISVGVIGLRLFDLIPIARNVVFESIPELVLVVDSNNQILDANKLTFSWLGKRADAVIGRDLIEVFDAWPGLAERFQNVYEGREEIELPGDPPRTYELTISLIHGRAGRMEGRVILARDVTGRKEVEQALIRTNDALKTEITAKERLQGQLEEQATRDPLTGAFNRRYLADCLEREVARSAREGLPLSVIILDVDHFKQFNDRYGHKCGDVVLLALSNMLRDDSRRSDIVCRYGGEEFVIAMFNTPLEAAAARAEDWRTMFESLTIEYEDRQLSSTFSAGVASLPLHGVGSETILRAADYALYRSKAEGRNRVTVYSQQLREVNEDAR